ncbi:hypothetical protein [Ruegeria arenilitoris]|uniref:hypothetical protein n=1 Tax=Ruegeria arenilitoris TaxID=1173585 RepID=UPI00148077D5|nr:hypothetical protein [Ruegeria arenilitoris]
MGHSHLTSIADVITGAYRFVVTEPDKDKVGTVLLNALVDIMWSVPEGNDVNVRERGICIRPLEIKNSAIKADVDSLVSRLEQWSKP